MKKFFLLAAAAVVAFASCSKNDQPAQREAAISFSSYTGRAITKADGSFIGKGTTELPAKGKFAVFAYNTGATSFNGTVSNVFMNNVEVTYAGGGYNDESKYSYSPLRYWPNDEANNLLSFFATYPAGCEDIVIPEKGWGAYGFTAQTDPADMVDFLFSEVAKDQTYSSTNSGKEGVVNMKFHHALTMVRFKVKTDENDNLSYDGTTISLDSIILTGVNTKGDFTATFPTPTTAPFGTWANQGTPEKFIVYQGDEAVEVEKDAIFLPSCGDAEVAGDAFLMVPQALTNAKVTVVYTVQTGDDDPVTNTATVDLKTVEFGDPAAALTEWKINQNIIYTFTIGLKPIKFIAQVVDWDDVTDAGITIPVPATDDTTTPVEP